MLLLLLLHFLRLLLLLLLLMLVLLHLFLVLLVLVLLVLLLLVLVLVLVLVPRVVVVLNCTCRCENGSWFNHVLEWWEAAKADPEHVMFLCYENMLAEPQEHIQKIAEFMGLECTPEILAKARSVMARNALVPLQFPFTAYPY